MARYAANAPINFELPAPVCVGALLAAGALTKDGHPQWAVGAVIFLYVLHLMAQWVKHDTSFAHGFTLADSIMMKMRASAIGLTATSTIAAVTVLMSGGAIAGPHIEHFTKSENEVALRPSTAQVDRILSAFNREQPVLAASAPHPALAPVPAAAPKSPPASAANPLEGKPLRYLIGTDIPGLGREGEITEVSYSAIKPTARGISVKYCNLLDEENTGRYGPYLHASDTAVQYNEGQIDPAGPGWTHNLQDQYERATAQKFEYIELDNADAYHIANVLGAVETAQGRGLKVIAKNPLLLEGAATAYLAHPNVFG
jgi:hypothetical protein